MWFISLRGICVIRHILHDIAGLTVQLVTHPVDSACVNDTRITFELAERFVPDYFIFAQGVGGYTFFLE